MSVSIAQQITSMSIAELEDVLFHEEEFPDMVLIIVADELSSRYYAQMLAEDAEEEFYEEDYYLSAEQDMWGEADFWDEPFSDF